ncbi:MAG: metal-dependent transcriptional regulator [Phycisphaerae bacterium]|jgi:DtxR family Mn-dependent transcriptional regulator
MHTAKALTRSLEDYLEAVLFLIRQGQVARVRDIARRLEVGMPSVTAALKSLTERGLVNYEAYQVVTLTDRGRELAEGVSQRHFLLRRFLTDILGLDGATAEANACRMEHAVDQDALTRLSRFVDFIHNCPRAGQTWLRQFVQGCGDGGDEARCRDCLAEITFPSVCVSDESKATT